jgi:hypothetical protein
MIYFLYSAILCGSGISIASGACLISYVLQLNNNTNHAAIRRTFTRSQYRFFEKLDQDPKLLTIEEYHQKNKLTMADDETSEDSDFEDFEDLKEIVIKDTLAHKTFSSL